jgi:peptidoglycan/xylan/chitin deacetylase (PgdA/CDA1 family)
MALVRWAILIVFGGTCGWAQAREIALTFDDAPEVSDAFYESHARSRDLLRKLTELEVPQVIIFANGCRQPKASFVLEELATYRKRGDRIANHTCHHVRLDDVGPDALIADIKRNEQLLQPLLDLGQKFFRFPYSNEGSDPKVRDQLRDWLDANHFRNGLFSIDDADYIFSQKIQGHALADVLRLRSLYVRYLMGAVAFYDQLAVKTIGYSPKHVMLLHEKDATVLFVDAFIKELRSHKWHIIAADKAYEDPLYKKRPKNTYSGFGLIAQLAFEKTGKKIHFDHDEDLERDIARVLEHPAAR